MSPSVIVPFRSLRGGKSRLACRLDGPERLRLCTAMLLRTLLLLPAFRHVLVVSDDEAVRGVVAPLDAGVDFLLARRPGDLNSALEEAREHVPLDAGLLVLPTDLMFLDEGALGHFIDDGTRLGIAPDCSCDGTNLLLLPAGQARDFRFQYGAGSFERHVSEAHRLGIKPRVVQSSRLSFDLDKPSDLDALGADFLEQVALLRLGPPLRQAGPFYLQSQSE